MNKNKNSDTFGINIMQYCRSHEEFIENGLLNGTDRQYLLEVHREKLLWLQHERLIHLIVTVFTGGVFLFLILLEYLSQSMLVFPFLGIAFIMLTAYLIHYFRLENHVQHWYKLTDRLRAETDNKQ